MAAPKVGFEQDGYRFKGGNPADPNSWQKLPPEKGAVENGYRFLGGNPADPSSWDKVSNEGGFWSSFFEGAETLGLADEAAAYAANPTEANRRALIKAGESKSRAVGFGEGNNWTAFKQMLGGSLGQLVAPAAAGLAATPFTSPLGGLAAASSVSATQYGAQNLLRQAQAQEAAIQKNQKPQEVSLGKAAVAAVGQTGLDLAGGRVFSGIAKAFPFMRPLLGEAGEAAAKEAGAVLEDAAKKGTITFSGGVARGIGKGVAFEVPQEVAQQGLERWQAGLSLTDGDAMHEYGQAAIGAALLGGTFGGVSGAIGSRASAQEEQRVPDAASTASSAQMDDIVAKVLTDPADKEAFDTLVAQYVNTYGIPEDAAAKLALGALRPAESATEVQAPTEEVSEPTLAQKPAKGPVEPPSIIPPIEAVSPQAQITEQLAAVVPPAAPTVEPVVPTETAVAAPVVESATPVEAPAPTPLSLPDAKKKVTPERIAAAKEMLNQTLQSPEFEGVEITPKEINAAAQKMVRTPGLEAPAVLTDILGIDAMEAAEAAPAPVEPEVATAPAPLEATPAPAPVESEATPVPVTKVAPGDARGARPVQRGTQGTTRGRPVEGAAQLTEGMKAQQALTAELEAARNTREISDAEVAETMDMLRPPASEEELKALPADRRAQWIDAIAAQRDVDQMQQRVNALPRSILEQPNPERVDLERALGALQQRLDAAQQSIVRSAREQFETKRKERKKRVTAIRQTLKEGNLTPAEERELRIGLRENLVSRAEEGIDAEATEVAQQAIEVAKQTGSIRSVIEVLAKQDSPLGRVAQRLLPLVPDIRVVVTDAQTVRNMARNPGERPDTVPVVEGAYVPRKKTIYLREDMQLDHVPLHEAVHAIIDGHIERGTLEGRELADLYNQFKSSATPEQLKAYGFRNAREFVAEVWGNERFRTLLQDITPDKKSKNLLQRIGDAVKRLFSKLLKSGEAAPVTDYIERVMQLTEAAALNPEQSELASLAESPQQKISKGLFKAQQSLKASGFTDGLDEATAGAKLEAKERRAAFMEAVEGGIAPKVMALQPTSWIRDAIVKRRPGLGSIVTGIEQLEQKMRGMRTSMERATRRRVKEFTEFVNKNGQGPISAMMTIARVNRFDPTAYTTRAEALQKDPVLTHYQSDKNTRGVNLRTREINDAWDAWEKLGQQPKGHETYKMVRQFYKDMYSALRAAQDEDIRSLGLDEDATNALIREAHGDIEADATVEEGEAHAGVPEHLFPQEYFPFRRFGEYVLIVQRGKRTERERYHFETRRERNAFEMKRAKELGIERGSDRYGEVFTRLDGLENLRDNMSNESFLLSKLFAAVDEIKEPKEGPTGNTAAYKKSIKDRLYQTYLMTLPERSLRKQFIHAELVTGQSADALRVFKVAASQYVGQLPKVVYGGQIQTQIEAAYDTAKEGDPAERAKLRTMLDTFVGRVRDTMDPAPRSALERRINEFTFLSMMTSVASAAVQPLTLPLQVMPRMLSRYGVGDTLRMLGNYTPLLSLVEAVRDEDPATGKRSLVPPTLGNVGYIKNNPLRARLWKELDQQRDLFSQKQTDMLLRNRPTRGASGNTKLTKAANAYEDMVSASGALFSSMDQLTREISGMSFAELEYNKLRKAGKSHEDAITGAVDAAVRNTNETIGNYTELEKIGLFRGGPIRRMLGFLRTYSVQRTAYYFRMLDALYKGDPAQTKLQAFSELSMVLAFTSLAAGVSANFGYKFLCDVINTLIPAMLGDDEMEEWRRKDPLGADDVDYRLRYEWLPKQFGADSVATRIAQRGALSELSEWDWTTRLSQSSMWIRDWKGGDTTRDDVMNFLAANLSPQVSQGANMLDGIDEFMRGNWSKGFSKVVPAAVRGAFTAERYAREGETTKANYPVMGKDEFSAQELVGQVLGFTPNRLSEIREKNRNMQAWQRAMREERARLFDEYRQMLDDPETTQEDFKAMVDKVMRYNAKVPLLSNGAPRPEYVIEPRDILQSLRSREKREAKTYRGVTYGPGEEQLFYPYTGRE